MAASANAGFVPSYSFKPKAAGRIALGALAAACCAAEPLFAGNALHAALWPAAVLLALAWSACDAKARILPLELSFIFGLLALAWQAAEGPEALLWALLAALLCAGVLAGTGKAFSLGGKPHAVGGGDVRLAFPVALACGASGILPGLLAAALLAALYMGARRIATGERIGRDTAIPLGPMLAAWALAGMAAGAVM